MNLERLKREGGCVLFFSLVVADSLSQGFLAVDQASGTTNELIQVASRIPDNEIAQSFTPLIPAAGFVQLQTSIFANSSGETLVINLRQGAFNGPIIGSTTAEFLVNKFTEVSTFYFPAEVALTPGQLYFFEPVLLSPGSLDIGTKSPSSYLGGDLWSNGMMDPQADLWFREGVVVPEPGAVWLLLFGTPLLVWFRRLGNRS